MMRIATMARVIGTLNDAGTCATAEAIATRWEHDAGTLRFWRASANFLFGFRAGGQERVLRFIDAAERREEVIRAELGFVEHLAARGIWVAKPVVSLAGRLTETVTTAEGRWNAVVFERLEGEQVDLDDMTPEQLRQWGRALGELHSASAGYIGQGRPTWQDLCAYVEAGLAETETAARIRIGGIREQLSRLPVLVKTYGLIHFDFEPDNLVWNGKRVGIVDFDDCAVCWFAADIVFALRDCFGDSAQLVKWDAEGVRQFVSGYREAKEIEDAELERAPLFLELHNLVTMTRLIKALGVGREQAEPKWATELREKLQRKIEFYRGEAQARINEMH